MGPDFVFLGFVLGKRIARGALKLFKRCTRFNGSFVSQFGQQLFELGVFDFKCFQLLCVGHFHAAGLGALFAKRLIADTALAAPLLRNQPSLMLFQYPNCFFFVVTDLLP